jgi:hypothetical protein
MSRSKLILLVLVAAVLVGVYLAGIGLGRRKQALKSMDHYRSLLGASRALAPSELEDQGRCISGSTVRVAPGRSCMVTAGSTWSLRRRVLLLQGPSGTLKARVVPSQHVDREVKGDVDGATELPVDREGASIVFSCLSTAPCVAAIK